MSDLHSVAEKVFAAILANPVQFTANMGEGDMVDLAYDLAARFCDKQDRIRKLEIAEIEARLPDNSRQVNSHMDRVLRS